MNLSQGGKYLLPALTTYIKFCRSLYSNKFHTSWIITT